MKTLICYKYAGKEYILLEQNNEIYYGYIENERVICSLTEDEKSMMSYQLFKRITSGKYENYHECEIIKYNDKPFKIMYDSATKVKFFLEVVDDGEVVPSLDDYIYLVKREKNKKIKYNNQKNLEEYAERINPNKPDFLKRVVTAICTDSVVARESCKKYNQEYQNYVDEYNLDIKYYNDETYDIEKFKYFIDQNRNLDFKTKQFLKDNICILNDYKEYIDVINLQRVLLGLNIVFCKGKMKENGARENVTATHNAESNTIKVFCANDIESTPKDILIHELMHSFSIKNNLFGIGLNDAITELITCEYCNKNKLISRSYSVEQLGLFSLIELIGKEPILKYYFTGNIDYIIDKLVELIDDEEKAYRLIADLDMMYVYDKKAIDSRKEFQGLIDEYSTSLLNKEGKDKKNIIGSYLNNRIFDKSSFKGNPIHEIIECKGYFNSKYKEKHPINKMNFDFFNIDEILTNEMIIDNWKYEPYNFRNIFKTILYERYYELMDEIDSLEKEEEHIEQKIVNSIFEECISKTIEQIKNEQELSNRKEIKTK